MCDGTWQGAFARGADRCQAAVGGGPGPAPADAFPGAAKYIEFYNAERPHDGLGGSTPFEAMGGQPQVA